MAPSSPPVAAPGRRDRYSPHWNRVPDGPGTLFQAASFTQIGDSFVVGQGGGPATLQISIAGNAQFDPPLGLQGPSAWLILNLTTGTAAGNVFVNALDVSYTTPGSTNLTGTIAGINGGPAAAVVENRKVSWPTIPIAPRSESRRASRRARRAAPGPAGVVEARDQRRQRRLAGAGAADQRDRPAGLCVQVDVTEHRACRVVAEVTPLDPDAPGPSGSGPASAAR